MKKAILYFLFPVILLTGCEFVSWEEWAMAPYDGLFTWEELTPKAEWSQRLDHAGAVFDGKLWIFGGYDSGRMRGDTYLEDIWSSDDGINWTLVSDSAAWKGRRGHTVNVFDNGSGEALYLVGGFEVDEATGYRQYTNDVWRSYDGVNWEQVKPRTDTYTDTSIHDFDPRFNHSCINVTFNDTAYLYLVGGAAMRENYSGLYSFKYYNDVWRTRDGIHWEEVAADDFGERAELAACFDEARQRIYIHGGIHTKLLETEDGYIHPVENYDAVWYSDDGVSWLADTSMIIPRAGHELFPYHDRLWIFPGATTSYKKFHMAWSNLYYTYRMEAEGEWVLDSEGSAFNGRHSYVRLIMDDKVYIMGGETGDMGPDNDVWVGTITE